jgi:hypothetical protein
VVATANDALFAVAIIQAFERIADDAFDQRHFIFPQFLELSIAALPW